MGKTPREINPSGIHWQRWIVRVVNELGIPNREVWRIAALLRRRVCQEVCGWWGKSRAQKNTLPVFSSLSPIPVTTAASPAWCGKLTFSPANWQGDSGFVDPPLNLRQANSLTRTHHPSTLRLDCFETMAEDSRGLISPGFFDVSVRPTVR